MTFHQVRIEMTGHGRGRVLVDGEELRGVRSVSFRFETDRPNVVSLELYADTVEVDAAALVRRHVVSAAGEGPPAGEIAVDTATGDALDALCGLAERPVGMSDDELRAEFFNLLPKPGAEQDPEKIAALEATRERLKQLGDQSEDS